MKSSLSLIAWIVVSLAPCLAQAVEEPAPEIAGLQEAASAFVTAYNEKNAAAISELFTEDGEITDIDGSSLTTGRGAIQARYQEIFETSPASMALEVGSVRLVAPNLAIEDGIIHLTPEDSVDAAPRSISYTAVLLKNGDGAWKIASTRTLKDVTDPAGRLSEVAEILKGEWTYRDSDGVQLDLAFGWDPSGGFLAGEMLTSTADSEPQSGNIRIGWDASKQSIVSWMFDANGGFTHGIWTATPEGWLVRSEGTTAEGESISASQELTTEGSETLIWKSTHRIVDGQKLPDKTLRIVRQAPAPAAE
jgi:uncharacterized protein (TIGR02246 family)